MVVDLDLLNARISTRLRAANRDLDFTTLAYDEAIALGMVDFDDELITDGTGRVISVIPGPPRWSTHPRPSDSEGRGGS